MNPQPIDPKAWASLQAKAARVGLQLTRTDDALRLTSSCDRRDISLTNLDDVEALANGLMTERGAAAIAAELARSAAEVAADFEAQASAGAQAAIDRARRP